MLLGPSFSGLSSRRAERSVHANLKTVDLKFRTERHGTDDL